MKRFFSIFAIGILLVFSGCFGDDEESDPAEIEAQMEVTEFRGIQISSPPEWDVLTRADSPQDFPQDVLLMLRSVEPWGSGETFATVSVASEELPAGTSSRRYAEAAVQKTEQEMIGFELINEENIDVSGNQAKLLTFSGKSALEEDTLEWQHLFVAQDERGYVVSSAVATDATESEKQTLRAIVTSFGFANAAEAETDS